MAGWMNAAGVESVGVVEPGRTRGVPVWRAAHLRERSETERWPGDWQTAVAADVVGVGGVRVSRA